MKTDSTEDFAKAIAPNGNGKIGVSEVVGATSFVVHKHSSSKREMKACTLKAHWARIERSVPHGASHADHGVKPIVCRADLSMVHANVAVSHLDGSHV